MNSLSIDIGNSKIKLDYWADDGILYRQSYDEVPFDDIKKECDILDLKGIIISSVRKDTGILAARMKEVTGCDTVVDFNQEEISKYHDRIKYKGRVGADRIAAFLGSEALASKRAKLIIDAGTAITLDIADEDGNYRGGNISLGLYSRMKDLAKATDLLPEIKDCFTNQLFGDDTKSAIMAGAKNGVIGEVLYTVKLAKQLYNIGLVLVTGGDYLNFYRDIEQEFNPCFYDQDLVGRGLNWHLRKFYFPDVFLKTKFFPSI